MTNDPNLKLSDEDRRRLQRLEEALWQEETRFDLGYMDEVLAADFFEFGRSGQVHSGDGCFSMPATPIDAVIPFRNLEIRLLASDVAQVTYDNELTIDGAVERSRRSSIWTRDGEGWCLRFHQGTPFLISRAARISTRVPRSGVTALPPSAAGMTCLPLS